MRDLATNVPDLEENPWGIFKVKVWDPTNKTAHLCNIFWSYFLNNPSF